MNRQQAKSDQRDNKRVFRWGIVAVVVLVLLAIAAYNVLSARRAASPTMQPSVQQGPAEAPKPPGS
jgi:hypothetical protein